LSFSDIGGFASYDPPNMTFTPANYNTYQTLTVTGNSTAHTTDQNYTIVATASSGEVSTGFPNSGVYNGLTRNRNAVNRYLLYDLVPCTTSSLVSCSAAATGGGVVPGLYTTSESGLQAFFAIRLRARPTSNVTIPISSSNLLEGLVSPTSLVFSSANWDSFQLVQITGVDDFVMDGNQDYTIDFGAMTGNPAFTQTIPSLNVTNMDDD
jgi:hypothetical protein